jgi:aminodeoxyfutalosine deaminase
MSSSCLPEGFDSLPKTELHLHLEGSIRAPTVCRLSNKHGLAITEDEVQQRYAYRDFSDFIEAYKWVTSLLREPSDYALITKELAEHLITQGVVYAEVTLSVGVMLLRKQSPEANFEAMLEATGAFEQRGLRLEWIFDAVRQFGASAAMEVVQSARRCNSNRIIAFGLGGDELSVPTAEFRQVYRRASETGLHLLIHAGEVGGPEKVREAVELLGVERIGHGIAAIHDPALMDLLAERRIPLEVCPSSNLCTGALQKQTGRSGACLAEHPLPGLLRHGVPIVLSTDDPPMFHTDLLSEYAHAAQMGLREPELLKLVKAGFEYAFAAEGVPDNS